MAYDISEILRLPAIEQEEIANAIYKHLNVLNEEDKALEDELDKRFAKVESGNYNGFTIDEIKDKLAAGWQKK